MTLRILLADDQELVRTGLRTLCEREGDSTVIADAADGPPGGVAGPGAPARGGAHGPAVARNGRDHRHPADPRRSSRRDSASGFLTKDVDPVDLRQAIRTVALGDALLAPEGSRALIEAFITRSPKEPDARRLKVLTLREREVLTLVGRGLSNTEIGRQLFLSPATVKTHVNRSMAKLGVRDRAQLVVIGYESGLVRPGEASGPGETWPKRFP